MHWDSSEEALAHPASGQVVLQKKVILFVGKPRVGKSSLINAILQREQAQCAPGFHSVTLTANAHWTRDFVFVDTPGLFATDLKMEDYVSAVSFIRNLGVLHAVVLVVNTHFLADDRVAADWLKFALCSPFGTAPTTVVVNQILAGTDEDLKEAVEKLRADLPSYNLFGVRGCLSPKSEVVMKTIKNDARHLFSQLPCHPIQFIQNSLGPDMEMRSFALAKQWLCGQNEEVAKTVKRIENESKWLLGLCDKGAEELRKIADSLPDSPSKCYWVALLMHTADGINRGVDLFRALGVPTNAAAWGSLVNTKRIDRG